MSAFWTWLGEFLLGLLSGLFEAFAGLGDLALNTTLLGLLTVFPTVDMTPLEDALAGMNYLFPLSETVGMASVWFGLWSAVWVYRVVKSWMPWASS